MRLFRKQQVPDPPCVVENCTTSGTEALALHGEALLTGDGTLELGVEVQMVLRFCVDHYAGMMAGNTYPLYLQ